MTKTVCIKFDEQIYAHLSADKTINVSAYVKDLVMSGLEMTKHYGTRSFLLLELNRQNEQLKNEIRSLKMQIGKLKVEDKSRGRKLNEVERMAEAMQNRGFY
jgi:hypothetical protein